LEERVVQRLVGQIIKKQHLRTSDPKERNLESVHPSHNICVRRRFDLNKVWARREPDKVNDKAQVTDDECMQKR
jgi:hypothetical protein